MIRSACTATLLATGLCLAPAAVQAAPVTWVGDVDTNWSTDSGPGNTNWAGDVLLGTGDIAVFDNVTSGTRSSTVDAATTIQALRINQTTTTSVNQVNLSANLMLSNNNALQYNSTSGGGTLANASMSVLDLNGNDLILSSTTSAGV